MGLPITILVMRHFPTPYNSGTGGQEKSRSWSKIGIDKQAAEPLAEKAAKIFDAHGVQVVTSSPLPRGRESAKLLADKMKERPEVGSTQGALTWNTGAAGKPEQEAIEERKKFAAHPDEPMPGGESFNDFRNRFEGFITSELAKAKAEPDKRRALVLHGHQAMTAPAALEDRELRESDWDALNEIKPGQVMRLVSDEQGDRLEKIDGGKNGHSGEQDQGRRGIGRIENKVGDSEIGGRGGRSGREG